MSDIEAYPRGGGAKKIKEDMYKLERTALAFTTGVLTLNFTVEAWAKLSLIVFEMPKFTGADPTGTVSIENGNDVEIYSRGLMAEDETHVRTVAVPLAGDNTIKVTLSTDPLSSGTCYVTLYLEG